MDFEEALKFIRGLGLEYVELHALWDKIVEELTDEELSEAPEKIRAEGVAHFLDAVPPVPLRR